MNPAELNLNPLSQLDPVVIVIVAVIVAITYLLLRRLFVLPYLEVMEAREELYSEAHRQAAEAARLRRESDLEAEAVLSEAAASAEEIRSGAQSRADVHRKECIAAASQEASEALETGRAELRATRERELAHVQSQAIECVSAACERLLGSADPAAVESAVVRLMERRAH